jgi:hypothetical protein
LGVVIENATTSAEAVGLAGLDWCVEQWQVRAFRSTELAAGDPDNRATEAARTEPVEVGIPDTVANVRTDTKAVFLILFIGAERGFGKRNQDRA